MSEGFWKKLSHIIGILPIGALFGLLVYVSNIEIKDLDLWLHLAMGRFITVHQFVPKVDMLSFTIAGHPWNNHEWLFQIIVYKLYFLFGPDGLLKMQTVVVTLTMLLLLFLGYNRNRQISTTFFLILVYLIYQQRFTIRPDLYSLLFFTIYIFILSLHIDRRWIVPFLFIIQVLWTNMHGFFFFGPLFVLIGVVSEWIKRNVRLPAEWNTSGRLTDDEYKRIKWLFVFVSTACFINPQFVEGALYPIGVFFSLGGENKIFFDYIQELQKPIAQGSLFDLNRFVYYKMMIVVSALTFVLNRRRIDISALFFWIIFLIFSLKAIRNATFFAFAAYLVSITNLLSINVQDIVPIKFSANKFRHITSFMVKFLLLLWIFNYFQIVATRGYYDFENYERKSEFGGVALRSFPTKAVDFLVENKIKGNFFNDFNSGAYLLGRAYPDIKVFIDGRTEVYGGAYFKDYTKIYEKGDTALLEEKIAKHNMTGALLNSSTSAIPDKIVQYFYGSDDWRLVYFDYDGLIFLRDIPENQSLIKTYEIDLAKWETKKLDLKRLGPIRTLPYHNYYRAYTLEALNLDEQALGEARAGLNAEPSYAEIYALLGKIYAKRKDFEKAFENFRIATVILPRKKDLRYNLARSYSDIDDYEHALKQYEVIQQVWGVDAQSMFFISKMHALNEDFDKAFESLEKAHKLNPSDIEDIINIGDAVFDKGHFEQARAIYDFGLKVNKEPSRVYTKLSSAYEAMGSLEEAIKSLESAIKLDPDNVELKDKLNKIQ